MRDWFSKLPSKLVEFWNKYTAKQKALFISVAAAVVITLVALFLILNRTSYVTLASFDDSAACAEAANVLENNGIKYDVSDDALTIKVDKNQESDARLLLAQNGVSASYSGTDTEWLFDNSFNTTDSEKKLKAKINLESTMEYDISRIEGVSKASVTINLPTSSSIYDKETKTTVSIMITVNSGYKNESTQAIAEYAKGCVGNSDTDNITIIDNQGRLLFSGANNSTTVTADLLVQQQIEEYYNSKLWNLMVNSGVYDEASVSAKLTINLSQEEMHRMEYYSNDEDETGPLDSNYYYLAENVDGTGGVVGTDANGEEITDYNLLDNSNGSSTLTVMKNNYSTSYVETYTTVPVGEVDMSTSSMSIILTKYKIYDEVELEKTGELDEISFDEFKLTHSEVETNTNPADIVTTLSKATGMKEASIQVTERIVPVFYAKEKKKTNYELFIQIALAAIIGLLLLFVVFKGMKPEEVVEIEPELSVEALLATTKENQTLDDIEFSDKSATKMQIEKFVDENPEAVAALLRNWLNDDWE